MRYTIFYDADCAFCSQEIGVIMQRHTGGNLIAAPLNEHLEQMTALNITREAAMTLLHIADEKGRVYIAMEAVRLLYRECGWHWQATLLGLPVIRPLSEVGYRLLAKYRYLLPKTLLHRGDTSCNNNHCYLPPSER